MKREGPTYLLLPPEAVPEGWEARAVQLLLLALTPEEATRLLAGEGLVPQLSPEEEKVARLVSAGLSPEIIARKLNVSSRSAARRLADLRERLEVRTNTELAALLSKWGF